MWTGRGEDDHPRLCIFVNVADNLGEFVPKCRDHTVSLFRPIENDMGYLFIYLNVEAAIGHGGVVLP